MEPACGLFCAGVLCACLWRVSVRLSVRGRRAVWCRCTDGAAGLPGGGAWQAKQLRVRGRLCRCRGCVGSAVGSDVCVIVRSDFVGSDFVCSDFVYHDIVDSDM